MGCVSHRASPAGDGGSPASAATIVGADLAAAAIRAASLAGTHACSSHQTQGNAQELSDVAHGQPPSRFPINQGYIIS